MYHFSRGKYISLEHAFNPPNNSILSFLQGSLQTLPNGNVLIGWDSEGQIAEYSLDGELVFHAFLDSGFLQDKVQNYRAFQYDWTGFSPETAAVFAEAIDSPPETNIYVSWNGDTETAVWRFVWFEETVACLDTRMKDVKQTRFETRLRLSGLIDAIHVEAINADSQVLMVFEDVQAVPAYWRSAASGEAMESNESHDATMGIGEL